VSPSAVEARHDWATEGAFEVAPGVHRIPLPLPGDGLRAVNVYAIEDGDSLVLVDAGWALASARRLLEESLATLGYDLGSIRQFLVTHLHRDHYTQAVVLRRLFGARVALGVGEQQGIAEMAHRPEPLPPALMTRLRRHGGADLVEPLRAMHGGERLDVSEWEAPDEWLRDGTSIPLSSRRLEVIATPGHTRGHVVFHDRDSALLFTGDHVLPHITPSVGFEPAPRDRALVDYLTSLAVVADLGDATLLPAHGPAGGSSLARVQDLQVHHAARLTSTKNAVVRGATTSYAAASELTWTRHHRRFEELDPFNRMLAVLETAAHLDLLVQRGDLSRADGPVLTYSPRSARPDVERQGFAR
jgi:glyoxylase-like metal-dependent hydrolase (beta-lactamase superfamily II)